MAGGTTALIESDASRLLRDELFRYCAGDVNGRSFLIAGHRGAGKTTLALNAYQTVLRQSQTPGAKLLRPLLVMLHGPDVLPDLGVRRRTATASPATPKKTAAPPDAEKPDEEDSEDAESKGERAKTPKERALDETDPETQAALVQITLGLHHAVAIEFLERYRQRILERAPTRDDARLVEMTAALQAELYQSPSTSRLRYFWERGGFLPAGVLRGGGADQGFLELVALSAVSEAYRRISGTLSLTERSWSSDRRKAAASVAVDAGKDFFGPLVALLTGGTVGTALSVAGAGPASASLGGAASALASALTLKASGSRSLDRLRTRDDTFLFDLSVATLDRVLPVLIQALTRCGLAPIFVMDELDKVSDLEVRMVPMVRHLKKFFAESGFFCFLADRRYFEHVLLQSTTIAFPAEYTYFSHRVFVVYRPAELHDYLLHDVFGKPRDTTPKEAPPGANVPAPQQPFLSADEETDREALPYIVLHRARMHPIDIQREILHLSNKFGKVGLEPGAVRSGSFRFDVMIQLAIEMLLDGSTLSGELQQDSAWHRVVYDALYYPSRMWALDMTKPLNLRTGVEQGFDAYLDQRINSDAIEVAPTHGATDPAAAQSNTAAALHVPDARKKLLRDQVRELAGLLSDPEIYKARWEIYNESRTKRHLEPIPASIFDGLGLALLDPPLLLKKDDWVFEWCYDLAGNPLRPPLRATDRRARVLEDVADIDALDRGLKKLIGGTGLGALTSLHQVLPSYPPWPQVESAISRLGRYRDLPYGDRDKDVQAVVNYATMLDRNADTLRAALLCATAIDAFATQSEVFPPLVVGLSILSRGLRLHSKVEPQVQDSVQNLWRQVETENKLPPLPALSEFNQLIDRHGAVIQVPTNEVRARIGTDRAIKPAIIAQAWISLALRLDAMGSGALPADPQWAEFVCAAAVQGPARYETIDVLANTPAKWSAVFAASLTDVPENDETVPTWFAPYALIACGFDTSMARRTVQAPNIHDLAFEHRKPAPAPDAVPPPAIGQPSGPAVLILKARLTSRLVDSLRSIGQPRVAALALTIDQLDSKPIDKYMQLLAPTFEDWISELAVEMPADPKVLKDMLDGPPKTRVFIYATPPSADQPGPQIVAPPNLESLLVSAPPLSPPPPAP
jgi:hypothetical protein